METGNRDKCLILLERVKGIEPSYSAWKAAALPLSYTRLAADQLSRPARRLNLSSGGKTPKQATFARL
jgi:hypothetical protein